MRAQLLFVFAFSACVPLVALGATALLKLERLLAQAAVHEAVNIETQLATWVLLLVIGGSAGAVFLSTMLSRDLVSSAGELVDAMHQVERGEMDAQLIVSSTDEFADAYRGFNRMTKGLSREVHEKVKTFVPARALPSVSIRGKSEPLDVYALDEPTQA